MIGFKNLKIPKTIKNVIKISILFLILFLYFGSMWINKNYKNIPLNECFFYMFSKTTGSRKKIISFIANIFLKSLFFSLILAYISNKINNNLKEKDIMLKIKKFSLFNIINFFERRKDFLSNINILKFKLTIKIKRKLIFYILMILKILIIFYLIKTSLNILKPTKYFKSLKETSNFIENNYVDPKNVNISFPEKKQNLVYIFINNLEKEPNFKSYSDSIKFKINKNLFGTNSKKGKIISTTLGIPFILNKKNEKKLNSSPFKNIYGLGNILGKEGYNQLFLLSTSINFENRNILVENHGNFKILDYDKAIEQNLVKKQFNKWHELDNNQLFKIARGEFINLSKQNKPFNLLILTSNSNFSNKIKEVSKNKENKNLKNKKNKKKIKIKNKNQKIKKTKIKNKKIKNKNEKIEYCVLNTSNEINGFVEWIKKQNCYKNTTIVIYRNFIDENKNKISLVEFINSRVKTKNNKKIFSNLDIFPSIISSLGAKIENNRLGLGSNLFSNKQTLLEKYNKEFIENEFKKKNYFYDIYCF